MSKISRCYHAVGVLFKGARREDSLATVRRMAYNPGMCGRFTLRAPASVVAEQFALFDVPPFAARYNIAPSQPVAVVRLAPGEDRPRRELVWLRWGLIPAWAKDPAIGNRLINTRAETAAEKPAFRAALRQRRCLLPADGFYEWLGTPKGKQPHFVRLRDDQVFAFAGLWESWQGAGQSPIESCTLLTTEPNDLLHPIHNRMPVILGPDAYEPWLEAATPTESLGALLVPYPPDAMTAEPVDTWVNSPANDGPKCIEPQRDLFG